jgi:hypothetical protein
VVFEIVQVEMRSSSPAFPLRLGRIACACAVAAAFPLVAPAVARAHLRAGTVAVDYRASIAPDDEAALTARVYQSDRAIAITVHPGHTVVVLGYLGEPFLRLDPAGVAVNAASPTSVGAGVLSKGDFVRGRMTAWRLQPGRRSVVWHDARVQGLPPGAARGPWSVPLLVDGRRRRLTGELVRGRRPAIWTWAAVAALLACAVLALTLFRPASRLRLSLVMAGVAGVAATVTAVGFALDDYASPGTWIASLDELVFVAVGFGVLAWGPRSARAPAAIGLGLLCAAVGISKGAVFLHPIVLSSLPGTAARLFVALAVGAGFAATVLGGASLSIPPAARPRARP